MARLHFKEGIRFILQEQVFQIIQVLIDDRFVVKNQTSGGQFIKSREELVQHWHNKELIIEIPDTLALSDSHNPIPTQYTYNDLSHLPSNIRDEVWRRYTILLPFLRKPQQERTHKAIEAYVLTLDATLHKPRKSQHTPSSTSARSVERWLTRFEQSGFDIRALIPDFRKRGAKGISRIDREVEAIINDTLVECKQNRRYRTIKDVYLLIVHKVSTRNKMYPAKSPLDLPSLNTVSRRIRSYDESILRRPPSRRENQANVSIFGKVQVSRILERVEIDHTSLDILIVDEEDRCIIGRPTLTYALDVYSGMPFGLYVGFEPPSYRTVAQCLLQGILPKGNVSEQYGTKHPWNVYGLPETLIVDGGREFIGDDLTEACGMLGIILERMPVQTPWFKGSIERFFKTQNTGLIHILPGSTFSHVLDRGDYASEYHACISLEAFRQLLHVFLIDIYAQDWHSSKECIPAKRWQENIDLGFTPCLHASAEEIRIMLMASEQRKLQRSGIEFEMLYYRNRELAHMYSMLPKDNRKVKIKYDPFDLSSIYVLNPQTGEPLRVPAENQAYTQNLSLWKHKIIRQFVLQEKRQVDLTSLAEAKAKIQQIVTDEYISTKRNRGRKTAARLLDIERMPPPGHTNNRTDPGSLPKVVDSHTRINKQQGEIPTDDMLDLAGWEGDYGITKS